MPAVQRARQRLRPRRADDAGRARRRRVGRQRPEAVEHERPPRRPRHAPRPHRLGRPQAPRHQLLRAADAPARRRGPPVAPDERPRLLQRGVPHRRPGAGQRPRRRAGRRLAHRDDDARPRARLRHAAPAAVRRRRRAGRRARPPPRPRSTSPRTPGTRSAPAVPTSSPRSAALAGRQRRPGRPPAHRRARGPAAGPRLDGPPRPGGPRRRPPAGVRGLARQARRQRGRPHAPPRPTACSPGPRAC